MAQNFLSDIKLGDNIYIRLGDSTNPDGDLHIYHDSNHSYIQDAGTGELRLAANVFRVLNANASETMIYAEQDGKVQLRFNEQTKFETTSTGIKLPSYGAGYLKTDANGNVSVDTSTIEDTLQSVTDRGSTTTNNITLDDNTTESPYVGYIDNSGANSSDIEYRTYSTNGNFIITRTGNNGADIMLSGHATDHTSSTTTFAGDVTVGGDLIVSGDTVTLSTQTVEVEDNIIQLNTTQGSPDTATAATSGISIYRGDGVTQASFIFDDSDDTWDLTNNLKVAGNISLADGWTLQNVSGGYAKFSNWVNISNTGFYTTEDMYFDLDDSSSRFVVRGVGNAELFEIDTSDSNSATFAGKIKGFQAGTGTSNSASGVAELSGQAAGAELNALSVVNSVTAASGNATSINFHNASNYSPTGKIQVVQEGSIVTDSSMKFYTYGTVSGVTSFTPKLTLAYNGTATFAGTIETPSVIIDSRLVLDNGRIYDNATNGNNKGFRIGGSGLIPINGSAVDTTNIVDLGSSSTRFKDLYLAGGASVTGAVTAGNIISTSNGGDASIYINSTRPTLGFTDTNSFTDANDIYIIRGTGGNKLQFQWYDDSAGSTTETFNIDNSGNATFAGGVTIDHYNGLTVDKIVKLPLATSLLGTVQNFTKGGATGPSGQGIIEYMNFRDFPTANDNSKVLNIAATSGVWGQTSHAASYIRFSTAEADTNTTEALLLGPDNSATFAGDITLDDNSGASPSIYLTNENDNYWRIFNGSSEDLTFRLGTVTKFDIDSSGNGTFTGYTSATSSYAQNFYVTSSGTNAVNRIDNDGSNLYITYGGTTTRALEIVNSNGKAIFKGNVDVVEDLKINPDYNNSNEYLFIRRHQSADGGIVMQSKTSGGSTQSDWQIVNHGTTGDLKFYAYGLADHALTLDREDGNATFAGSIGIGQAPTNDFDIYKATGDASIRIESVTASDSSILKFRNNNSDAHISVDQTSSNRARMELKVDTDDGFVNVVSLEPNRDTLMYGKAGIGTTSPDQKLHVEFDNTDTSFSGGSGGAWGSEGIRIENTSTTVDTMAMLHLRTSDADIHIAGIRKGTNDSDLGFFFEGTQKVLFENDGSATFAGSVTANTSLTVIADADSNAVIKNAGTNAIALFAGSGDTLYLGGNDTTGMYLDTSANATFVGDVTVDGGDFNLTKQNGAPYINMLWDGNNPSANTLLHYLNYKVDYNGTHQDWGGIEHRTTSSATRTELRFNVKSASGNVQNALTLQGQASAVPNATFAGDVQINGDLIVTGATTSVNVEDLNVEQGEITLNYAASSDTSSSANGAGIRIQDAVNATTDATMLWNTTSDRFEFSNSIQVTGGVTTTSNNNFIGGMSSFETTLTNNDDWQNSPISLRERDNVGSNQSADKYSPNLNFHWGNRVSRSLWMDHSGHLHYGEYSSSGIPNDTAGHFLANEVHASVFKDKDSTGYYLDPAGTGTSLNVAGGGTFAGGIAANGGISGLTLANGGISGSNYNISGVNQLSIADPGEGIVFGGGSSGNIVIAAIDDSSDNVLAVSGAVAEFRVAGDITATGSTVSATDGNFTSVSATDITASTYYGQSYSVDSTSGTTAIIDTVTLLSTQNHAAYEVIAVGNPNAGGSGSYRDYIFGKILVTTGFTSPNVLRFIHFVRESPLPRDMHGSGGGNLTMEVVFWDGSSESETFTSNSGTPVIRVKIDGYNSSHVGNSTTVRLKRIM